MLGRVAQTRMQKLASGKSVAFRGSSNDLGRVTWRASLQSSNESRVTRASGFRATSRGATLRIFAARHLSLSVTV